MPLFEEQRPNRVECADRHGVAGARAQSASVVEQATNKRRARVADRVGESKDAQRALHLPRAARLKASVHEAAIRCRALGRRRAKGGHADCHN